MKRMDLSKKFSNVSDKNHNSISTLPTKKQTLQKIRTVPNILKRRQSGQMNNLYVSPTITFADKNIRRKKQTFDPLKSELLIWENLYTFAPIVSEININNTDGHVSLASDEELDVKFSKNSPMWCCPIDGESELNRINIEIVETVTINIPIGEVANSIFSEFIEDEFRDFHHELNIPIFDMQSWDVETIIELSRFECKMKDDELEGLMQEDPFDKINVKNSWGTFECLSCGKTYRSQYGLNYHLKIQHKRIANRSTNPIIVLTCPRCFNIFKTYSGYDRHTVCCNGKIQFHEE